MIESGEGDFAQAPETIDIVSGTQSYNLATIMTYAPVKVRLVERLYGTDWSVLSKWERNSGVTYSVGIGSGEWFPSYRFTGTSLTFNQVPSFTENDIIRVSGYKIPAELSLDADTLDANFHDAYAQLLVLWSTIACLESKESTGMKSDLDAFRLRLSKLEDSFINTINSRSESRESVDPFVCGE